MPVQAALAERVDSFVKWLFKGHQTVVPRGPKVINDSLLGNQYFARHEIAVINSPLLQRLRRIKQTGLVYYVFPSATHSRFEHCLGAATLAEKCFTAIQDRISVESPRIRNLLNTDRRSGDLAHLRMAALLHDVGHGLCSHASEQIYETLSDLREFKNNPKHPEYAKNSPGEILSYLMICSNTFRAWFQEYVNDGCKARINLDVVGEMVLGKHRDKDKFFLSQIISSPFDADKLDYIARDSYYCGLALTVDLPRFYSMISTAKYSGYRVLVLRSYVPLEQILFSKMTLYGSIYHHHKVKCLDSMLRSLVHHIYENKSKFSFKICNKKINFAEPVEYLYVTDDDLFNHVNGFGDPYVRQLLDRFMRRDLFVRALEVSRRTVKNWDTHFRKSYIDLSDRPDELQKVEQKIFANLPKTIRHRLNHEDIRLSVPSPPKMKPDFAFIQASTDGPIEHIEEFFPVEQWIDAYSYNKWKSFLYAPREVAEHVSNVAIAVLEDMGLQIDAEKSARACHLS